MEERKRVGEGGRDGWWKGGREGERERQRWREKQIDRQKEGGRVRKSGR